MRKYTAEEIDLIINTPKEELKLLSKRLDVRYNNLYLIWRHYQKKYYPYKNIKGTYFNELLQAAGVTKEFLLQHSRIRAFLVLKHLIAYILRQQEVKYTHIARMLGYKDHTTAMHAVAKIDDMMITEPWLKQLYLTIKKRHYQLINRKDIYDTTSIPKIKE